MRHPKYHSSLYLLWAALLFVMAPSGCKREKLEESLVSSDMVVRSQALHKLAVLPADRKARLVPKLIPYLKDPDSRVTARALNALVAIGPSAVDALGRALADPDVFVRLSAAVTLGQMGPAGADSVTSLSQALQDTHPLVREEAAFALGQIGSAAMEAAPALKEAAKADESADVRATSAEALRKIEKKEGPGA